MQPSHSLKPRADVFNEEQRGAGAGAGASARARAGARARERLDQYRRVDITIITRIAADRSS